MTQDAKAAIEKIQELVEAGQMPTNEINGRAYANKDLVRILKDSEHAPDTVTFHTLTGMINFIETEPKEGAVLHVESPGRVSLFGPIQPDNANARFLFANCELSVEQFLFGSFMPLENFIISLMSLFVQTEIISTLIEMLGKVANEHVSEQADDGFSQSIQVRTGITTKTEIKIVNPMSVKPFRTFLEVDQPESDVVFRMRNDRGIHCSLHIADGGMWKLTAIERIAEWLKTHTDVKVLA